MTVLPRVDYGKQPPHGRHSVPEEQVIEWQKGRAVEAAIVEIGRRGYSAATVARIIDRAEISRRTFYELFEDRLECGLEAYDAVFARVRKEADAAFEAGADWAEAVCGAVGAILRFLASHPTAAHTALVEIPSAGPRAIGHVQARLSELAGALEGRAEGAPLAGPLSEHVAMTAIGAAVYFVTPEVREGRAGKLDSLAGDVAFSVLLPFVGPQDAEREVRRHMSSR